MKIRNGFVSNSSSTSFYITNTSDKDLSLFDFVKENKYLIDEGNAEYGWDYTLQDVLVSALNAPIVFPAYSTDTYEFGDEDGTAVGHVFDYMLREGGDSENFNWRFHEYLR